MTMVDSTATSLESDLRARDAVLSALGEGILLFDPSGELVYANPIARSLLGAPGDGHAESNLLRQAISDILAAATQRIPHGSSSRQVEMHDAVIEASGFAARPPGSVVVVLRDVTQVRNIEQLRRDFVANASHELKTPVASIVALSEALQSARDDQETTTRLLPRLAQEAGRLGALVRDLLDLARLEGGPQSLALGNLNQVVETEAERLMPRAESEGLHLTLSVDAADIVLAGSESELSLLLHNLLDNAFRHTPEGGRIHVGLHAVDGAAVLTVEDTGEGIPPRDLDRIFERFYRVDTARSRQTGGTGLGLSIVRNAADKLGGTVHVASRLGHGATFTVRIPLPWEVAPRSAATGPESGSPALEL